MTLLIGIVIGFPVGWYIHKAYVRYLYRVIGKLKRQARGGKKVRRRLWIN